MANRANLLDLMSPEDKAQALASYEKRMSGNTEYRKNLKIPPLVYLMAELGYYFGWGTSRLVNDVKFPSRWKRRIYWPKEQEKFGIVM